MAYLGILHQCGLTYQPPTNRMTAAAIAVANGFPVWNGAGLAVDTTLVLALTREGQRRRRAGGFAGAALHDARRSKKTSTNAVVSWCLQSSSGVAQRGRSLHQQLSTSQSPTGKPSSKMLQPLSLHAGLPCWPTQP